MTDTSGLDLAQRRVTGIMRRLTAKYDEVELDQSDTDILVIDEEIRTLTSELKRANEILQSILKDQSAGNGNLHTHPLPNLSRDAWRERAKYYLRKALDAERKAAAGGEAFREDMVDLAMQWRDLSRDAEVRASEV